MTNFMPHFTVTIENKPYAWAQELSEQAIATRQARTSAEKIVGVIFLVLTGVCFLAFLLIALLTDLSFMEPSAGGLLLTIAVFFAMVSFSHLMHTLEIRQTMPPRALGEPLPEMKTAGEATAVDIAKLFDPMATKTVDEAYSLAKKFGHATVEPLHLFVAALSDENAGAVLSRLQVSFEKIKEPLGRRLASRQLGSDTELSTAAEETLLRAFLNAYAGGRQVVNAIEIFYEAFLHDAFIEELFFDQGVTKEQFANMVAWVRIHEKMRERYDQYRRAAMRKPTGAMNRAMTSVATPTLDAFSEDLTTLAVSGRAGFLVGREKQIEEVFRVIEGGRQSAVLVGPEGVGKRAILEGIAALMVEERVPEVLQDKRLVRVSIPHLLSGAEPQEAQERLMFVLSEASRSGNIILAFSDLEQMTGELSTVLVDFLSRGVAFAIATTTPQGYTAAVERSVLGRVFEKVNVPEPEAHEAIRVLESKALGIEGKHHVSFTYQALEAIVKLSDRFMHETFLPKKAIELAREVALMVATERGVESSVTPEDVERLIGDKTGIPTTRVETDEKETLLHLEERMHGRVVGQAEAVKAVSAALRRARTQLKSENRPIATFLFLGPTGVGKTELAKTVAETYFGSEDAMVRLDMSEYQEQDRLSQLIGRSGMNEGGVLTEAVRTKPFSLVLLDEFEKAHPNILNLFLQVFDDGRLTDAAGRTVDFTNTILIATSNAGSDYIQQAMRAGEPIEQVKVNLLEEKLRGVYRPELLNRFDGVIVFSPLTREEIIEITKRMVANVAKRLEAKGIHFRADDAVIAVLAQKGYDPLFGARPLRRLVQEEVDNAIAEALLRGEAGRRDTIVLETGGIRVEKAKAL